MKSAAPQQDSPENPNASAGEPDAAADVNDTKETPEGDADLLRRVFGVLLRRSLIFSVLLVAAAVTIGALAWYLHSSQRSEQQARAALTSAREATSARQRAEQIALDYSRGAAEMDFKDIPGWTKRLTTNTSPELTKKLKDAAASMEQIVVPPAVGIHANADNLCGAFRARRDIRGQQLSQRHDQERPGPQRSSINRYLHRHHQRKGQLGYHRRRRGRLGHESGKVVARCPNCWQVTRTVRTGSCDAPASPSSR
jgi:hypothetical protein